MSQDLTPAEQAADALLAAVRQEFATEHPGEPPDGLAGCALMELVWAVVRQPGGATPVLTALTDMAYSLGLQLDEVDPAIREGVLRVMKNQLNDGARSGRGQTSQAVH